jgi:hypothetical protein
MRIMRDPEEKGVIGWRGRQYTITKFSKNRQVISTYSLLIFPTHDRLQNLILEHRKKK